MIVKRAFITLIVAAAALTAAAQPADDRYVVRLDPAAAVDRVDVLAAQLAATHGGTVVSTGSETEDTIVLQLSPSRVRALAADPRVRSVDPVAVPAEAVVEAVNWTAGVDYTYDGAGAVTRIGTDRFVYDAVGRLVLAKVNAVERTYTYDAFGNRTGCSAPGTDCQYATSISSGNNRISKAGTEHDDAGNVTKLGAHTYAYDAVHMMTKDHSNAGGYEYLYTADDERLATFNASTGTWEWTLRDHLGRLLRELTSSGSSWEWKRDYVYRDGLPLAARVPSATSFTTHHYHLDHLGTPRRVTDDQDLIAGYHDYYAFGPEIAGSLQEPNAGDVRYTGHEREPATDEHSLDYMHARFYNATLGRFLSGDPVLQVDQALAYPQTWNRYAYARNSPLSFTDPDGRETNPITRGSGISDAELTRTKTNKNHGRFSSTGIYRTNRDGSKRPHWGTDRAAPVGTQLYAPVTGTIVVATDTKGFGGKILIFRRDEKENGQTVYIQFSHLQSYDPKYESGSYRVTEGELLNAFSGDTGYGHLSENIAPKHLHLGVRLDHLNGPKGSVDPQDWFNKHPSNAPPLK